jgi:hypothetical protein
MPLFRTVDGKLEAVPGQKDGSNLFSVLGITPDYANHPSRRYMQGYCKPLKLPHPHRWRGPRLRTTHKRPSRVPRRYRVNFERAL